MMGIDFSKPHCRENGKVLSFALGTTGMKIEISEPFISFEKPPLWEKNDQHQFSRQKFLRPHRGSLIICIYHVALNQQHGKKMVT